MGNGSPKNSPQKWVYRIDVQIWIRFAGSDGVKLQEHSPRSRGLLRAEQGCHAEGAPSRNGGKPVRSIEARPSILKVMQPGTYIGKRHFERITSCQFVNTLCHFFDRVYLRGPVIPIDVA